MSKQSSKPLTGRPVSILSSIYQRSEEKENWKKKILNVLKWAVIVAIISTLIALLTLLTGGTALPAGITLIKFLLTEAIQGLIEGLIYGTLFELVGGKKAKKIYNEIGQYIENLPKAKVVSEREILVEGSEEIQKSKKLKT